MKIRGSISGKITDPRLSGAIPPDWAPGDPWLLWEAFAKATIGLRLGAHAKYRNEYNPSKLDFDGDCSLNGDVKAGVYTVAKVSGYTAEREAAGNAGVGYNITLEGASPNKGIKGQWEINAVTLNTTMSLVNDNTGENKFLPLSGNMWFGKAKLVKKIQ